MKTKQLTIMAVLSLKHYCCEAAVMNEDLGGFQCKSKEGDL
jgi:hypothetical protein